MFTIRVTVVKMAFETTFALNLNYKNNRNFNNKI